MGNSHSNEHVSLDDFKEQVFSQVVFFISKYANHQLEFQPASQCTPDYLPSLKTQDYQAIINYYQGGSGDVDYHIENYLNEHVLNSQENVTRFHKILMAKLSQDPEDLVEEDMSDDNLDMASVASNVQQFINSYEEPQVVQSHSNTSSAQRPSSPKSKKITQAPVEADNQSRMTNKTHTSAKSQATQVSAKTQATQASTKTQATQASTKTQATQESVKASSVKKRDSKAPVVKGGSDVPVSTDLPSNYSGEFTQPYEIPDSEYPMEPPASEYLTEPMPVQEVRPDIQVSEHHVENLVPEIQAEHMSEEELSECLVSRI